MHNFQLLFILICMVGEAFFSGMETGVISIHRMRLKHYVRQGSVQARALQGFLDNPDRLFGVTLVGTNVCVVTISVLAASFFVALFPRFGETVSAVVMTVLVLLFCEYIPKAWFHTRPFHRCRIFVRPLLTAEAVFRPLSWLILNVTSLLAPGTARTFAKRGTFVTREDLKTLVHEGEQNGVLSPDERVMIHRVFELSSKRARDIMIPVSAMVCVHDDTTVKEFLEQARSSKFTRMPVLERASGAYAGVVNVFFVLSQVDTETMGDRPVKSFVRAPLFISDTMPVDDIFPRLRRGRQPMCLVRNAEGRVLGLITTEDILEEIVGKL